MKTVYLVRHGESESNREGGVILGAEKTALTERGMLQAAAVAERCGRLTIDAIVSSTALRAKQTAGVIAESLKLPLAHSEHFLEWDRGSHRIGKVWNDPELLRIEKEIVEHLVEPAWRRDDEENFADLSQRAARGLQYLLALPEENILLVGHGLFSRILLGRAVMGDDFTGRDCQHFLRAFKVENTGLAILRYGRPLYPDAWEVVTWNDHAHLG